MAGGHGDESKRRVALAEGLWLKGKGMSGTQRRYGLYLSISLGELRSSPVQAASAGKLLIGLITEA